MTRDQKDSDLDRLQRGLLAATPPAPDGARDRAMAAALAAFDALPQADAQGSGAQMRSSQDRPVSGAGFLTGVRTMLSNLAFRPVLAATTSAAALGVGLFVLLPMIGTNPGPVMPPGLTVGETTPEGFQSENPQSDGPQIRAGTNPAPPVTPPTAETLMAPESAPPGRDIETVLPPSAADADMLAAPQMEAAPPPPAPAPPAPAARSRVQGDASPKAVMPGVAVVGSVTPAPTDLPARLVPEDRDSFANAAANPVRVTVEDPVSTFSVDVDTASYAVIRRSLMAGALPPADAVRIEEMVNYFPYDYPAPAEGEAPFHASVAVMETPWNADTRLVRIGLQGRLPAIADRPPLNLVLLVDTSGSMQGPDRLPLLKQSLRLLLPQLRPEDQVAMVAYAGSAGEVLPPTRAEERETILAALDRLEAGGSTAGAQGLDLAYRTARRMTGAGEVSRVLLATDGDFNVGASGPDALRDQIARERDSGIYLSVLGFGRGNLDDATMQALAQNGNGQAAYIDTLQEARKVLVDQLSGALFSIADDVKIQVEWNPAEVAEYRLIGYETRMLAREDFNNDRVDAGEIGAGHSVTALYEVTAPDSPALRLPPLRYQVAEPVAETSDELGFLRLRYKAPGETQSALIEAPILPGSGEPDPEARFAAAIAGFGQLLTGATYLGDWGWTQAIALALEGRGADEFGYRAEAISLMRLAQGLSAR
ncbi:vWA domain-containing protein [Szabonella alba]|uniref:von Willebrand factor type A domain-containing protein n=1 Tax=Szabonella alba TaxID=2804194 RepID=A0A8K0XZL3_9RHOB|nr:von Willebrand factor type A domain-containing protein [Szabonella alba]MBL4916173.1 von Willebrand factor type A domain-containing protein [Szabonella alba]